MNNEKTVNYLKNKYFSPDKELEQYLNKDNHKEWFYKTEPYQAPYALLSNLSNLFNNITIYDIGTFEGCSALALSSNKNNKVVSYDIFNSVSVNNPGNIEFIIGDYFQDTNILKSLLISYDVDPHDGVIEIKTHEWFLENNYSGIVVYDDIHLNQQMQSFWDSIKEEKYDVTDIGHYSGTGIVFYNFDLDLVTETR